MKENWLTNEDLKDIIKCVLFTSCSDLCLDNTKKTNKKLFKLAIKLAHDFNIDDLTDTNLYIMDNVIYDQPKVVKKLLKYFNICKK